MLGRAKIEPVHRSFAGRVVHRTALFLCLAWLMLSAHSGLALAKMTQERLWLVTAQGEREIAVEVAASPEDMAMGLMFRTSLPDGNGMLFPSASPREASMWMRNTFIPLDMVFIRADGVIHRIEVMTEPHSETLISSNGDVLAVLELAGGASGRLGLKQGDRVRHRVFNNPR